MSLVSLSCFIFSSTRNSLMFWAASWAVLIAVSLLVLFLNFLSLHSPFVKGAPCNRCFPIGETWLSLVHHLLDLLQICFNLFRWSLLVERFTAHFTLSIIHIVFTFWLELKPTCILLLYHCLDTAFFLFVWKLRYCVRNLAWSHRASWYRSQIPKSTMRHRCCTIAHNFCKTPWRREDSSFL